MPDGLDRGARRRTTSSSAARPPTCPTTGASSTGAAGRRLGALAGRRAGACRAATAPAGRALLAVPLPAAGAVRATGRRCCRARQAGCRSPLPGAAPARPKQAAGAVCGLLTAAQALVGAPGRCTRSARPSSTSSWSTAPDAGLRPPAAGPRCLTAAGASGPRPADPRRGWCCCVAVAAGRRPRSPARPARRSYPGRRCRRCARRASLVLVGAAGCWSTAPTEGRVLLAFDPEPRPDRGDLLVLPASAWPRCCWLASRCRTCADAADRATRPHRADARCTCARRRGRRCDASDAVAAQPSAAPCHHGGTSALPGSVQVRTGGDSPRPGRSQRPVDPVELRDRR